MPAAPKPAPKAKRRGHADPVTPDLWRAALRRDGGCVAPLIDRYVDVCRSRFGLVLTGRGRLSPTHLELNHVHEWGKPTAAKRAPSDLEHTLIVCGHHHHDGWVAAHAEAMNAYLDEQHPGRLAQAYHDRHGPGDDTSCYVCHPPSASDYGDDDPEVSRVELRDHGVPVGMVTVTREEAEAAHHATHTGLGFPYNASCAVCRAELPSV